MGPCRWIDSRFFHSARWTIPAASELFKWRYLRFGFGLYFNLSSSADCNLIASVGLEGGSNTCLFRPPQMAWTWWFFRLLCNSVAIWSLSDLFFGVNSFFRFENSVVYEIYPQGETLHLTQIAHLDFDSNMNLYLLPGKVIWYDIYNDIIVFRNWNYRLAPNHSISFSVHLDIDKSLTLKVHFISPKRWN